MKKLYMCCFVAMALSTGIMGYMLYKGFDVSRFLKADSGTSDEFFAPAALENGVSHSDFLEMRERADALENRLSSLEKAAAACSAQSAETAKALEMLESSVGKLSGEYSALKSRFDMELTRDMLPISSSEANKLRRRLGRLPDEIGRSESGFAMSDAKKAIDEGEIEAVTGCFVKLAEQGLEAALCIGPETEGVRSVWIEVDGSGGLSVLCKNLPLSSFTGLKSREGLPAEIVLPEYLIRYENGKLRFYSACEQFKSKSY